MKFYTITITDDLIIGFVFGAGLGALCGVLAVI